MVAAAEVHQPWWMDERKLLMRRLSRLNLVHHELTEGLPDGVTVRREATKPAKDMLVIYVDGQQVERVSNLKGDAAALVAQWIEEYRQDKETERIMGVSQKGLELLKELVKGGIERKSLGHRALVADALAKKDPPLVVEVGPIVLITEAGIDVLRGLPEFDHPVLQGQTSPPTPLLEERGESEDDQAISVDKPSIPSHAEFLTAQWFEENGEDRLVRVVMADGIGLDAVVKHCGSEIMGLGGTVIKLELGDALLREIYPPLVKFLEGLEAINVRYSVFGDLQIVVERPLEDSNDHIPFELR